MAFRIRDLMISVLTTAGGEGPRHYDFGCNLCTGTTAPRGCQGCTGTVGQLAQGCPACTGTTADNGCPTCTGTTPYGGGCPACTGTTGGLCAHAAALAACGICTGISPALGDQRPQALALLKQQLQGLLAEVEAEERRLEEEGFPQSAEEVEALEKRLEEALAEVRSRKAGMGKKKKG